MPLPAVLFEELAAGPGELANVPEALAGREAAAVHNLHGRVVGEAAMAGGADGKIKILKV